MSLAEILVWKFNNAPGIRTRERNGKTEIFDWPEELGQKPTPAQISQWKAEYNARPPEKSRDEDLANVLDGAVSDAERWAAISAYFRGS